MPIRFQVDPDFYDHPKAIGMSDSATALWVRAGSYSAAKLTDGFVAEAALSLLSRCPAEAASELVERGLWRRVRGGYRFHQWDRRNLTKSRIEAEREADRIRKQEERLQAKLSKKAQANGHSVRSDGAPDSGGIPDGLRSVSVLGSELLSGSGLDGEPPSRCPQHVNTRTPPNCGQCADARRERARWEADRNRRIVTAPKCRVHRGELADNCGLCRFEELNPA